LEEWTFADHAVRGPTNGDSKEKNQETERKQDSWLGYLWTAQREWDARRAR
jgi:hypothetical protein